MKNLQTVFEYLELTKKAPLGASKYAPLIIMVNNDKKIVEELLDKDNMYYSNLWSFLDYGLVNIVPKYDNLVEFDQYSNLVDYITLVLTRFNNLDNKWTISGDEFIKLLKKQI